MSELKIATVHPVITKVMGGEFPKWVRMTPARKRHARRVAALLGRWAEKRQEGELNRARWVAAGMLHDALKDDAPSRLRARISKYLDSGLTLFPCPENVPDPVLHGPAAAAKLALKGVEDQELLLAIAYHTIGHPNFGSLGKALIAADFLEPGRKVRPRWRRALRKKAPEELDQVVLEILGVRLRQQVKRRDPLRSETVAFWNVCQGDEA